MQIKDYSFLFRIYAINKNNFNILLSGSCKRLNILITSIEYAYVLYKYVVHFMAHNHVWFSN